MELPGAVAIPIQTPEQLMESKLISETIASNFIRRSPSRWMKNLFGQGRAAIEHQVRSIIAGAVWAIAANLTLPNASEWKWFTERDALVCELCRPLHGMTMSREELEALYPRHPGCRCSVLPISGGRAP